MINQDVENVILLQVDVPIAPSVDMSGVEIEWMPEPKMILKIYWTNGI